MVKAKTPNIRGTSPESALAPSSNPMLFWTCFFALVATSFGFIIRTQIIGDLGVHFNLSETQKGEILGVGLWPFSLSIILFSLIIDKIGYGRSLYFAFACHVVSAFVTIFAKNYWMLYIGTFILAIGNGTVEAVINPAVATLYSKDKTKWLNILHAGWPGGMVLGGLMILLMGTGVDWRWKVGLILIPVVLYGIMLIGRRFPVHERVQAGVPFKAMLQEVGVIGMLIVASIMISEIGRIFAWSMTIQVLIVAVLVIGYGLYVRSWGQPLFIFLCLVMIPLATTELGTDSWITELVTPVMGQIGLQAGWVLVYTAFLMMVLRFSAGPIVHRLSPLGLLAVCSTVAAIGLVSLSKATGAMIFVAATVYGLGKSFFWPTMLGVTAERFPKGGALTMNAIAGIGMLSVGVIGAAFLGNIQDKQIDRDLLKTNSGLHASVTSEQKASVFGKYKAIDQSKIALQTPEDQKVVEDVKALSKKNALMTVAVFPVIMLLCYIILILYFRSKGGYKPVELSSVHAAGKK